MPLNNTTLWNSDLIDSIITNVDEATDGQALISNGDGTATFETSVGGGGVLLGSVRITNLKYDASVITVDSTANTFTIVGNTLKDNDSVVFVAYGGGTIPAGIIQFKRYYVVGKSGDTFSVSLTSGGAAFDITSKGGITYWRLEKPDANVAMTISGLSNKRVYFVTKLAVGVAAHAIYLQVNGVSDTVYYGANKVDGFRLIYSADNYMIASQGVVECDNNVAIANGQTEALIINQTTGAETVAQSHCNGLTYERAAFGNLITSIKVTIATASAPTSVLLDGSFLEVYSL